MWYYSPSNEWEYESLTLAEKRIKTFSLVYKKLDHPNILQLFTFEKKFQIESSLDNIRCIAKSNHFRIFLKYVFECDSIEEETIS